MSILIKGMEMPKSCYECPFFVKSSSPKHPFVDCKIIGQLGDVFNAISIPIDCPLIEVPKHGRLIDADEFLNRAFGTGLFCEDDMRLLGELVGGSPTVIPADKEGDG